MNITNEPLYINAALSLLDLSVNTEAGENKDHVVFQFPVQVSNHILDVSIASSRSGKSITLITATSDSLVIPRPAAHMPLMDDYRKHFVKIDEVIYNLTMAKWLPQLDIYIEIESGRVFFVTPLKKYFRSGKYAPELLVGIKLSAIILAFLAFTPVFQADIHTNGMIGMELYASVLSLTKDILGRYPEFKALNGDLFSYDQPIPLADACKPYLLDETVEMKDCNNAGTLLLRTIEVFAEQQTYGALTPAALDHLLKVPVLEENQDAEPENE